MLKAKGEKIKYCGIPLNFDFLKPVEVLVEIEEQPEYGILVTRLSNNIKMFYREEESEVEYDEDQKGISCIISKRNISFI